MYNYFTACKITTAIFLMHKISSKQRADHMERVNDKNKCLIEMGYY